MSEFSYPALSKDAFVYGQAAGSFANAGTPDAAVDSSYFLVGRAFYYQPLNLDWQRHRGYLAFSTSGMFSLGSITGATLKLWVEDSWSYDEVIGSGLDNWLTTIYTVSGVHNRRVPYHSGYGFGDTVGTEDWNMPVWERVTSFGFHDAAENCGTKNYGGGALYRAQEGYLSIPINPIYVNPSGQTHLWLFSDGDYLIPTDPRDRNQNGDVLKYINFLSSSTGDESKRPVLIVQYT